MSGHFYEDEIKKVDLKVWRVLGKRALKYPQYFTLMVILAIVMGLMQAAMPWIVGDFVDMVFKQENANWFGLVAFYFGAAIVFSIAVWCFITTCGKLVTVISHDLRKDCFNKLQNLSFSYYDHKSVGWLVTRLTSDADRLARIFSWGFMDMIWGAFYLIFVMIAMILKNWQLALIVLSVLPPLLAISIYFKRKLLKINREVRKTSSMITASFSESIAGVRTTKTLVREEENSKEFDSLTSRMYGVSVINAITSALYFPAVTALGAIGSGLALWIGGMKVDAVAGGITIGTLVAFVAYTRKFFMPIQDLARLLTDFQSGQAAAERIVSLLETEPDIFDSEEVKNRIAQTAQKHPELPANLACDGYENKIETVEFKNVSFEYIKGEKVLKNFNLKINTGETIALVGPTGGGKSTIVSLICRFYQPTEGEILINGIDYRKRSLDWLSSNLGIVLQTPQLFSGPVIENIRYGNLTATDDMVKRAASIVHADKFIDEMPDNYYAVVGEGGNELSTGQKQLISFARAIIADPQIFVMDEATSSIDTETELAIQQGLEKIFENRISFVIAHRLSTIRSADRILFVRAGEIVEHGTHHELLEARGEYFKLYSSQFTQEHTDTILAES